MKNNDERCAKIINTKSIYCYPNTEVLINKLGITDKDLLDDVERSYSTYKLSKIYLGNFSGNFDLQHYLDCHKYIFNDLYEFAGEIRSENITKNNIPFCRPEFVSKYLNYTLLQMKKDLRKVSDEDSLLNFLAHYYGELDIIHPFREGNGRVQREFFRQYMSYVHVKTNLKNYKLEYSQWNNEDKQKLITGCFLNARSGDTTLLKEVLSKSLVSTQKQEVDKKVK